MTKEERYRNLVAQVSDCTLCDGCTCSDNKGNVIKLEHEAKPRKEINLWSHWQNNLDADILVIGQDWGNLEYTEGNVTQENIKAGRPYMHGNENETNLNLIELLKSAGIPNAKKRDERLFFVNAIQCYKTGGLNSKITMKWFEKCGKYLEELINIIQPAVIVTLGKVPYQTLSYVGKFEEDDKGENLAELVERGATKYTLSTTGFTTNVFRMYHCGKIPMLHRKMEVQKLDWEKIKDVIAN